MPVLGRRDVGGAERLPSDRIARILFFVADGRIGVVHGFIKRTQKTPAVELALAHRRMKEMTA